MNEKPQLHGRVCRVGRQRDCPFHRHHAVWHLCAANDLDTLLRHSDSPNENYTVEVRGSRKGPYSGYDADVYLIDNKTNTREYINALTDEQHIYIKWTSETEFYIGMTDYMITDKA